MMCARAAKVFQSIFASLAIACAEKPDLKIKCHGQRLLPEKMEEAKLEEEKTYGEECFQTPTPDARKRKKGARRKHPFLLDAPAPAEEEGEDEMTARVRRRLTLRESMQRMEEETAAAEMLARHEEDRLGSAGRRMRRQICREDAAPAQSPSVWMHFSEEEESAVLPPWVEDMMERYLP